MLNKASATDPLSTGRVDGARVTATMGISAP
jgi:hypothetical protein